jgi:CHAT domain-containing protein
MVKRLSAEGRLADYRVLHFATHGALAGELENVNEPGLILTPPREQSEDDDGYLSASEITKLKLDADLVILSACNTGVVPEGAAGDNNNWRESEAQLGLAFAFFHAGARALLVSNWAVDSAATVKVVTGAIEAGARAANVGRAEALQRSMLAMIDHGEKRDAHPSLWAPFVLFGEGAPAR